MVTMWRCIPCGATSNVSARCWSCGRRREDATDAARWERFFAVEAEIVTEPEGELLCDSCGRRFADGSDPCDDCREPCPHDHVQKDDDGRDNWFYVCDDCDTVVTLTPPDEDGKSYWETIE